MKDQLITMADRLPTLDPGRAPLWGRMTPHQMVEHLIHAMRISNGVASLPLMVSEREVAVRKRFLFGGRPLPREFANPALGATAPPPEYPDIAASHAVLLQEIERFFAYHDGDPGATPIHPVFGPLSGPEWEQFHVKHFTHHLEQFGVGGSET